MDKRTKGNKALDAREQKRIDKAVEKFLLKSAVKNGEDYFDSLINSLKGKIDDIKQNKRHWKDAVRKKTYPDGRQLRKELIVQQIEWTAHAVSQIDLHYDKAIRAASQLTIAFNNQQ